MNESSVTESNWTKTATSQIEFFQGSLANQEIQTFSQIMEHLRFDFLKVHEN